MERQFFSTYFDSLKITSSECVSIECLTRNQSGSDLWATAREERLTASNFGICKLKKCTKPDATLKDILNYRTFDTIHTKYGKSHENVARKHYERFMRKSHPGLTVKKCGLLVTPDYPHLGASPDGYINCTHCESHNGLLEIKCPSSLSWRMKTPEECATDSKFFCVLRDGKVTLKQTHNYYYQVQGQLGISGRKWCDFVVWTCVGISVERIFADKVFFTNHMVPHLNDFYLKAFIPELFSCRDQRGIPL
ncbi:uncharacterized protein LOC132720513 [Ruditapes philippinarum]|uniref:uncharacterized protein LOC132720513 n=1 Tax=Ruditapes philippinarum TaxID=129788 RepID=UPI00295C06BC|nr:uncharacterized protein LOC132720513 [Ruditapes philippinarum]